MEGYRAGDEKLEVRGRRASSQGSVASRTTDTQPNFGSTDEQTADARDGRLDQSLRPGGVERWANASGRHRGGPESRSGALS